MDLKRDTRHSATTVKITGRNEANVRVKLCGYLKKRNKVGGWRKMWFVLQDKLMLSYSSQEEYDNKLSSFKDVLNLIPGTVVRCLSGYRFTIETTTHITYTFHCDDRLAYREWITLLLESLSPAERKAAPFSSRFHNVSMDNVNHHRRCSACDLNRCDVTNSLDFLSQPKFSSYAAAFAHEQTKAKNLEHNGNDLTRKCCNRNDKCNFNYAQADKIGSETVMMIKDQVQRMKIKGCKEELLNGGVDHQNNETTKTISQHSNHLTTTTSMEEIIEQKCTANQQLEETESHHHQQSVEQPVYAVINLKDKYARRMHRNCSTELERCSSYDSIKEVESPTQEQHKISADCIAADSIENIYEDDEQFFSNETYCNVTEKEENIYEPINVPASHSNSLWKYFTRLKVNSLLRLTRNRNSNNSDCDDIRSNVKSRTAAAQVTNSFAAIKRKFGSHRKSMQLRMRKLCRQASYEDTKRQCTDISAISRDDTIDSNSKPRYRWRSVKIKKRKVHANDDGERSFGSLYVKPSSRLSLFASQNFNFSANTKNTRINNSVEKL